MHLVNSTTAWLKRIVGLSFALFFYSISNAQENSPYSRYGLGDMVPTQNIVTRGMGGVSIADEGIFKNNLGNPSSINFKNPAALGSLNSNNLTTTIFDLGGEVDIRTLRSTDINKKYSSTNTLISYLQVAFPIAPAKWQKNKKNDFGWGLSFGLRPVTRINYKIEKNERLTGIDSLNTLYEGSGGVNQFNVSTGIKFRNFSLGVSSGYTFGNKDYSTQLVFINDTVAYMKSNTQAKAHFGGVFVNVGLQYKFKFTNGNHLNLGAYTNLQQNLTAKQDKINETFAFDGIGGITAIDTVSYVKEQKGTVVMPATYGFGFNYQDSAGHWTAGVDFELTNWKDYSYYKEADVVQNSWVIRAGAQYYPAKYNTPFNKYWRFVTYRAGFYIGPDYVKLDEKTRMNYAVSIGATFPLTPLRLLFTNVRDERQFILLHTSIEYGGRGNKESISFRENTLRFGIGISMNASWFRKRNYY